MINTFEKILLDVLKGGEIAAPIFIHSPGGIAILNASEEGLAALLGQFGKKMMTPTSGTANFVPGPLTAPPKSGETVMNPNPAMTRVE